MLLSVDTDISIRKYVFLLESLTTTSGLLLFIILLRELFTPALADDVSLKFE